VSELRLERLPLDSLTHVERLFLTRTPLTDLSPLRTLR